MEIDFKDEKAFKKYKAKHKMRGSTKVNIAGKDTTVDKADSMSKGDVGGPSYPNVPKGVKSSDDLKGKDDKKMSDTEKEMDTAAKYANVKMDRGEALDIIKKGELTPDNMQDTFEMIKNYADWMGYEDELEDFENDLPDIIDDGDVDTFESYAEELLDPDKKEKEMGDYLDQMDGEWDDEDRAPDGGSWNASTAANTPTPKQMDRLNQLADNVRQQLIDTER